MTLQINRCRVLTGLDELPAVVAPGPVALVHDAALADSRGLAVCRELLGADVELIALDRPGTLADAQHLSDRLTGKGFVVAYGGGSLIDTVKLALALCDPLTASIVGARQRSGWILGPDHPRPAPLVVIPTTIGTAAEVSGVATFLDGAEKRAFTSLALQADVAILDPRATEGLPREILVEGCLEIVLRCVGPVVGAHGDLTTTDHDALELAARVVRLLDKPARGVVSTEDRATLALLSVSTQQAEYLRERSAFTVKAWFLANNLSHHLGVRKMVALANLMPAYWARLPLTPAFGSAARLHHTWSVLRDQPPPTTPEDPAEGLSHWLDSLGVPGLRPLTDHDIDTVTVSCARMWGAGLPMLAGVDADDIHPVLRNTRSTTQTPALTRVK